jgi:nucleotide-binding universal stress UspA family protein
VAILKSDKGYVDSVERILIPIGGKEIHDRLKARLVHSIYRNGQCQITLMTIISPNPSQKERKRAEDTLQRAANLYNIPDAQLVVEENEQRSLAITARAAEHDLLMLGMQEEPWFQSFFFGTVAQQVAGQVQCPTLLVKAQARERSSLKRLLRIGNN